LNVCTSTHSKQTNIRQQAITRLTLEHTQEDMFYSRNTQRGYY